MQMKLKLSWSYVLSFLALTFLMHELHEIVHTCVGRWICGDWGKRDFNVWDLCEGCAVQKPYSVIATFAGPAFTFMMIWIGTLLMTKSKSDIQRAFGFSLVFSNMPFARFFGAATGGGDEVWGLNLVLHNHSLAWIIGLIIVFSIVIYPLYKSFKIIANESPIVWFLVFLIIPPQLDHWVVLIILNSLLSHGILSDYWILGSPIFVTAWTVSVTLLYFFTRKNISKLAETKS